MWKDKDWSLVRYTKKWMFFIERKLKNKISEICVALKTKPFLILAGVSGTGKTQIARIVVGMMSRAN